MASEIFGTTTRRLDFDRDGINDLPHRELDLFGCVAPRFSGDRVSFRQSGAQTAALRERARGHSGHERDRRSRAAQLAFLETPRATLRAFKFGDEQMITARKRDQKLRAQDGPARHVIRATRGEITLLVGPNGAGKSTTMKLLAGLVQAGWRDRAHQWFRHRRGNDRRATRTRLPAATTKFSSAAHLSAKCCDFTRVCAVSHRPLRSDARAHGFDAKSRAYAHGKTLRWNATAARPRIACCWPMRPFFCSTSRD